MSSSSSSSRSSSSPNARQRDHDKGTSSTPRFPRDECFVRSFLLLFVRRLRSLSYRVCVGNEFRRSLLLVVLFLFFLLNDAVATMKEEDETDDGTGAFGSRARAFEHREEEEESLLRCAQK